MVASIGDRWEAFVAAIVSSGRYSSARDVVQEGPRLVEERKAKLSALRDKVNAAIADGGLTSDDGIGALPETNRSIGKVMDVRADFDRLERPGLNVNGTAPWRLTTRSLTRLS